MQTYRSKACAHCGSPIPLPTYPISRARWDAKRHCSRSCAFRARGPRGPYEKWPNDNARWTEAEFRTAVAASGTIAEAARRLSCGRATVSAGIARLALDTSHFRGFGHITDAERFWRKVDKSGECWLWTDVLNNDGYGRFRTSDGKAMAHVFAFVSVTGAVPAGLELDHTCNNRACVRPSHLEAVTHAENVRRARARQDTSMGTDRRQARA